MTQTAVRIMRHNGTIETPDEAERRETYYAKQVAILQTLEALRTQVMAHGASAAGGQYHWGYIGDLGHMQDELNNLLQR